MASRTSAVAARTPLRLTTAALAFALLVAACGQYPGARDPHLPFGDAPDGTAADDPSLDGGAGSGAPGAPGGGEGPGADGSGGPSDAPGGGPTSGGGTTTTTGGGSQEGADGTADGGEGGSGESGEGGGTQEQGGGDEGGGNGAEGARTPQGSDRTGVTDDTITLAIHAPVTGAAPLPARSFEAASDLYWRWVTEEQGQQVLGRDNVEVVFADDMYEPSTARQVCRQLASRAVILVGGGGTDQIQTCGQLSGQMGVPYFSPGVTEVGLDDNPWYFAASMTYRQQGPLLAQYVNSQFGGQRAAAIVTQTANFNDAVQGWEAGVQEQGIDYYGTLRHPRGDTGWHSGFAAELADNGVEVVYMLTSPLDYIRFAQRAQEQGHDFQYVGVGVTMGLNAVLQSGCDDVEGGHFFSPFPALEVADDFDPDFRRAANRFGAPSDDIAWALWGINKTLHALFHQYEQVYGHDLTREDFREVTASAGTVESGVFPPQSYSPDNHFGGTAVNVLRADCSSGQHRNGGTWQSSF